MKLPRTVVTPGMLGRTVGVPGDSQGQRMVVLAAMRLLETAATPGTILDVKE